MTGDADLIARAAALAFFRAPTRIEILGGGKTNRNLLVEDQGHRFVVRFGQDIPEHGILRWHELAVTRAAAEAGIGPAVRHMEAGLIVLDHAEAVPLTPGHRTDTAMVPALAALVARVHREVAVAGPVLAFHLPQILQGYAGYLVRRGAAQRDLLPSLMAEAEVLQAAIGPAETVLCHNDLLPGNILVGARLWLIDWEYAGFGNPLFDLGGIAGNNGLTPAEERVLLEVYHDAPLTDALWRRYVAMKCASLLRETLWSMVSEITSTLADVDYAAYTADNLAAYRAALAEFRRL